MIKLEFNTIKDLLSFIKLALYMSEKSAAQKMLKWKKNRELYIYPSGPKYVLELSTSDKLDKEFNKHLQLKYNTWLETNKQSTLKR